MGDKGPLDELRQKIGDLDRKLAALLEERAKLSKGIRGASE